MATHSAATSESVNRETAKQWFDRNLAHLLGQSPRQFSKMLDMEDTHYRKALLGALNARYKRVVDDETGVVTIVVADEIASVSHTDGDPVMFGLGNGYLDTATRAISAIRSASRGWEGIPCDLGNALLSADESLKELRGEVIANGASLSALSMIDELSSDDFGLLPRIEEILDQLDDDCVDPIEMTRTERFAVLARRALVCFREALEEISSNDDEDIAALLALAEDCGPEIADEAADVLMLLQGSGVPGCALEGIHVKFAKNLSVGGSLFDRIDVMRALRICEQGPRSWTRLAGRGRGGIRPIGASAHVVGTIAKSISPDKLLEDYAWDENTKSEFRRALQQFKALAIPICERLQEAPELMRSVQEKPKSKTSSKRKSGKGPPKSEAADMPE